MTPEEKALKLHRYYGKRLLAVKGIVSEKKRRGQKVTEGDASKVKVVSQLSKEASQKFAELSAESLRKRRP